MEDQSNPLWTFINESDMEFFEKYLKDLSEKELQRFLDKNPDFLRD